MRVLVEELLRTDNDCGGSVRGWTTLKFRKVFMLCGRCHNLFECVDIMELRVGIIYTDIVRKGFKSLERRHL